MSETISLILGSATVSTALSGVIIWITKNWISERLKNSIKHEYDLKIEVLKTNLKAESDQTLERLKADLHMHNVRSSKLIEQRGEVIKELHAKIDVLAMHLHSLVYPLQLVGEKSIEDKDKDVFEAGKALEEYYRANKIYFEKQLCDKIDEIQKIMASGRHWFIEGHRHEKNPVSTKAAQQYSDWKIQAWKSIEEKVPLLKEHVENEFRKLLGV
jgi:hypothetical protein